MSTEHPKDRLRRGVSTNDEVGTNSEPKRPDSEGIESSLSRFEACLETPVVPGELVAWADAVQQAYRQLGLDLRLEIDENHPGDFAQIGSEDSDLLRRVEQLLEEDDHLLACSQLFSTRLQRLCGASERAEPHEGKLDELVAEIVAEGLALVIRIRKQQQALKTWLMESFQRDTGIGD